MFSPKKIKRWICQQTTEPVLWTWPSPSSSSSLRILTHLAEKHQHNPALVSSSHSKFFLNNEKVISLVKQHSWLLLQKEK
jgi:hypothetical protein